jgi:hypothetical protein
MRSKKPKHDAPLEAVGKSITLQLRFFEYRRVSVHLYITGRLVCQEKKQTVSKVKFLTDCKRNHPREKL